MINIKEKIIFILIISMLVGCISINVKAEEHGGGGRPLEDESISISTYYGNTGVLYVSGYDYFVVLESLDGVKSVYISTKPFYMVDRLNGIAVPSHERYNISTLGMYKQYVDNKKKGEGNNIGKFAHASPIYTWYGESSLMSNSYIKNEDEIYDNYTDIVNGSSLVNMYKIVSTNYLIKVYLYEDALWETELDGIKSVKEYSLDGYTWNDETKKYEKIPINEDIGYPLEFRYFIPGMYGQSLESALLIGNNLHDFQATWENKDGTLGYMVQIEYKGTYSAKKNFLSSREDVTSDYVLIDELKMSAKKFTKDEIYIDRGVNAPVYINVSNKLGYKPPLVSDYLKFIEGKMRIRYVKYDGDKVEAYGKWVTATISADGNKVVVTDDDGNVIETEDYGDGVDYTDEDLKLDGNNWFSKIIDGFSSIFSSFVDMFNSLSSNVGNVPNMMKGLLSYLPNTVFVLLGTGIVIAIILRILGR